MADPGETAPGNKPGSVRPAAVDPIKLPNYEIVSSIGKGGMGEVFLAHDLRLDRNVAIKVLSDDMHGDPKAKERFIREAKAAAALDHPFICKIFEAGEHEGLSYIVMEYVEGRTLKDKIAEKPLGLREALSVTLEVAEALEAAHEKGIVHRDLKPSNLMCTPQGHVKVMDFGLAKHVVSGSNAGALTQTMTRTISTVQTDASITEKGVIVGTIAYMSPEQARGDPVDAQTDIFSLGIVLAEIVSGKHPFDKPTPLETLTSVLRDNPPPVHVTPKSLSPDLTRILIKAMAKDPGARYPKIGDMAKDVRALLADVEPRAWLRLRGRRGRAVAIGGSVLVVAAAAFVLLRPGGKSEGPPPPKPVRVLIDDFENRTGDPFFDGTLEQTFALGLEGTSFITLYDRSQARRLAGELDPRSGGKLETVVAQLICRREGVNAVIHAVIEPAKAGGYTIRTEALDPVSSDVLAEHTETIPEKSGVLKAVGALAGRLRDSLESVPVESFEEASKETFTAATIEAMRAYARAQDLTAMGRDAEAIKEYQKALESDPNLGRAYAGLAVVHRNHGELGEALKYYDKAMGYLAQMTERERFRTRGGYYFVGRNYKKAIEEFGELRRQFPMDIAGYINLPLAYFYARDMSRAFEEGKKAVAAYPGSINPLYNLIWYAIAADRLDDAEAAALQVIKLDDSFAEARVCLGLVRLLRGKPAEAASEYHRLEGPQDTYAASLGAAGLADLALYEGRLSEARKALEAAVASDLENGLNAFATQKKIALAETLLSLGSPAEALKSVESALAGTSNESVQFACAMTLVRAGRESRARELAESLAAQTAPEPQAYARLIRGEIDLARGRYPEAIREIHEAQAQVDTWIGHFSLGRAYLEAGQFTEAYSEFESCWKRRGETASLFLDDLPTLRYLPPVHYYLGRAQEGLKIPAAAESYKRYLEIKILAEGDPLVGEAKRRLGGR